MVAVLIASASPELLNLARASVTRFAPPALLHKVNTRGRGAQEHADAIEWIRFHNLSQRENQIILFDDDAVVLSHHWLSTLQDYHAAGYDVVGGIRSRGDITQSVVDGQIVPHAHCLSFTAKAFHAVKTFAADPPDGGFVRYDTAVRACLGLRCKVLPFRFNGPLYGNGVAEYTDEGGGETLWAHLGRGTSFAPKGPWREGLRRAAARIGFRRAQKILRYQALRADYITRTRTLLGVPSSPPQSPR